MSKTTRNSKLQVFKEDDVLFEAINKYRLKYGKYITYKVNSSGCWICTSHYLDGDGYPNILININGITYKKLHRAVCALFHGELKEGSQVLHSCDTPSCINPSHLRQGTHQENVDDKLMRSRQPRGDINTVAKLKEYEVKIIISNILEGIALKAIGDKFGVSEITVSNINTGRSWKHLTTPYLSRAKSIREYATNILNR